MQDILFYIFAALTLACGALVILNRNPINSAMFLVLAIASLAGLFVLLQRLLSRGRASAGLRRRGHRPVLSSSSCVLDPEGVNSGAKITTCSAHWPMGIPRVAAIGFILWR